MGEQAPQRPIVIAHRGASGERPEHTMAAYRLAIAQGADFVEPDLVLTHDGVLVCRHENEISGTTDVADHREFADRRVQKTVDGVAATGWWVEDFTLEELRTLRAKERLPQLRPGNTAFDGQEEIPTFAEVLALAQEAGVGVYPELKHPTFFTNHYRYPVQSIVRDLEAVGWSTREAPVFIQCFETFTLQHLNAMTPVRKVQLIAASGAPFDHHAEGVLYADMITDAGLAQIARYADGIGVEKTLIIQRDSEARSQPPTDLVARAHAAGLVVHPWTFRAENYFLPAELRRGDASAPDYLRQHGDFAAELRAFYAAGVDALFSDFPGAAVAAR
jgi:glycerophosphoryl diester phosphodiesterase